MNCKKCGYILSNADRTCPVCGTASSNDLVLPNPQNMTGQQVNAGTNGVSANGLQLGAFTRNNNKPTPLMNPNSINKNAIPTDDIFSSPKVSVNQVYPNQQQPMMNNQQMMNNNRPMMNQQQPMNQNMFNNSQMNFNYSNNSNNNDKKSNSFNPKILITVCLAIVLVVGGIFSFRYFQSLDDKRKDLENEEIRKEVEDNIEDYEEQRREKAEQMKKNITLAEDHVLYDGSLLFTYENNNNTVAAVELEIEFYDSDNNFLGTAKEYAYPAPFSKFLIKFNVLKLKPGYASYKMNLTVSDYELQPVEIDTSKFVINDNGEAILVQYPNNSNNNIDNLELCILYYKQDKIVGAECSSVTKILPNTNANFEYEYFYAYNYEGMDFDTYRFAVSAYNKVETVYE